ncbi:MAG TPA: DUF983 domain-containing protein [Acidimicrobiales bacterium]
MLVQRPSLARMVLRALLLRCPWCGGKGWTTGLIRRTDRCRSCGYKYERQPGFALGAVTMNTMVTFGALALVIVIGFVATYPDIAAVPIVLAAIAVTTVVPVVFYPFSYTLWAAIDLTMRPLDAHELADAAAHAP